ncbi:MAG: SusD/RagB family nutrient-binding outer membrane lipoprotein [Bacteroidetes bacterium]|nr:SusD/RagB family nutrient-binding outer membrane lipoprotein [Bacteroidota bacterium]
MKTTIKILFVALVGISLVSCSSYLDINTNPNAAISSTPSLLMSSALVGTARTVESFNAYGMQTGGYGANAGGYGGFNEYVTYQYTNATNNNLWINTYANLINYQQIINLSQSNALYVYYQAIAEIMMAHNYQLLVDEYNNVPYTNALAGINNLTPTYDNGTAVYPQLASLLDDAMAKINQGMTATPAPVALTAEDIVFGGNMTSWLQLANTLKLKLMVRGNTKATFTSTSFDPSGFLTTDVLINPGFKNDNGRQNPKWGSWAWDYAGNAINKAWMPTPYVLGFYDGNKLADAARGTVVYYQFSTGTAKITNQLGYENSTVPSCPEGTFWYSGSNRTPASAGNSPGTLKGPDAGYPLFTAAESYFLQAEAALDGIAIPGSPTDAASFGNGIVASFKYLYSLPNGTQAPGLNYAADAATYVTNNAGNYLADYTAAVTPAQKLEAIITQKYIALNFIHSHEGWNEYRRTTYPYVATSGQTARNSFASIKSQSTRPDKLPTRLLYPQTEALYNPANVPQNISPFTSLIFWAQ